MEEDKNKPEEQKKKNRGNINNLRAFTTEQAREYGRKGGIASAKAKKERKEFREILLDLLDEKVKGNKNLTQKAKVAQALIEKAAIGDVQAFNSLRDTIGEKPVEKQETDATVRVVMDSEAEKYSE